MFSPQQAVIATCIDYGAIVHIFKPSQPLEPNRVLALEELPERYCAHLLKGFGKIAFEILGEVFSFALFDCIAAKLDYLKILHMFYAIHGVVSTILTCL